MRTETPAEIIDEIGALAEIYRQRIIICPRCGGDMLTDCEYVHGVDCKAMADYKKPVRKCLQCGKEIKVCQ